jgi:hypothetical protein
MIKSKNSVKLKGKSIWLSWRYKGKRGSKGWKRRKGKRSTTERMKEKSKLRIGKLKGI